MLMSEELDKTGFIVDYGQLDAIKKYLDAFVEHRHLNEAFPMMNPTAENLAKHFYGVFKAMFHQVFSVRVKETEKTEAVYADMPDMIKVAEELSTLMKSLREQMKEHSLA